MEKKKGQHRALSFIFITVLVDIIGLAVIIPVMPALIEELTGEGISQASRYAGWLLFSFAIMQFLFSPMLGALSDRYGRRPVLLISLFGLGLDYVFNAVAPTLGWLFVGRIIAGFCGASITTAMAYIADVSTPEKRAQNFGLVGVAFGLGFIVGPLVGGLSGEYYGPRAPFIVAACLAFLNVIYGYFVLPESLPKELRRKFEWKRANPIAAIQKLGKYPVISGLVVCFVFLLIAAHSVQSNWTFFTTKQFDWSEADIGYSLAAVGFMVALVQGFLIRLIIPKLGQKKSVYLGLALYAVGLLLFAFANEGWMMYAFLVPYCMGGISGPALQGIMANQVPPNEQGELQGSLTSVMSATSIIGPVIMTGLFAYFTSGEAPVYFPGVSFLTGCVLVIVSIFFAIRALKRLHV